VLPRREPGESNLVLLFSWHGSVTTPIVASE
jgi:hypothetical protein